MIRILETMLLCVLLLAGCGSGRDQTPTKPNPHMPDPGPACVRSGCSGEVCVEQGEEVYTICIFRPEFACYDQAVCERQPTGECGWTETPAYLACLEQARATE